MSVAHCSKHVRGIDLLGTRLIDTVRVADDIEDARVWGKKNKVRGKSRCRGLRHCFC